MDNSNDKLPGEDNLFDESLFPEKLDLKPNLNFLDHVKSDGKEFTTWHDVDDGNRETAFLKERQKELKRRRMMMIQSIDDIYNTVNSHIETKLVKIKAKTEAFATEHKADMPIVNLSNDEAAPETKSEVREKPLEHSIVKMITKTTFKTEIKKDEPVKPAA